MMVPTFIISIIIVIVLSFLLFSPVTIPFLKNDKGKEREQVLGAQTVKQKRWEQEVKGPKTKKIIPLKSVSKVIPLKKLIKKKDFKPVDFNLSSKSIVVMEPESKMILFEKESQIKLPIASLTKLMTAIIFLESRPKWNQIVILDSKDERDGGKLYLGLGDQVTIKDLFYSSLIGSANNAAVALVRLSGLKVDEFVAKMNLRAKILGMKDTSFTESTGLDPVNTSTALDIAKLARYAFKNGYIKKATSTKKYYFRTVNTKKAHYIKNTDKLLLNGAFNKLGDEIMGSKTGYLDEAGYCLAILVKDKNNHELLVVIIGSPTSDDRFSEAQKLISWVKENYQWE